MATASPASVENIAFKVKSQVLHEYIMKLSSDTSTGIDYQIIKEYLDSIETSDTIPTIHTLGGSEKQWINCERPLDYLVDLKGKLLLIDFFTYCCINCLHILPYLTHIESSFSVTDGLVVIGVHSAKFNNERDSANIQLAAERYSIQHPIINDSDISIWTSMEITCWPTLLLVSPTGKLIYVMIGEVHIKMLHDLVQHVLEYYKTHQLIKPHNLPISQGKVSKTGILSYPGKLHLNSDNGMLYISDTAHHRILEVECKSYTVVRVIGSGRRGNKDGNLSEAEFNSPHGLDTRGNFLYVADTENHLIRVINIKDGIINTLCGTGLQGNDKVGGALNTMQEISSPWDIVIGGDVIYIAMAGTHQIWVHFLEDTTWIKGENYKAGTTIRFAGNGEEANRNNSYPHHACFAQPSGISLNIGNGILYVADSESGTIRAVSIKDGSVAGIVGGGLDPMDLFAYGDENGIGRKAKLQHPMGVAFNESNHCIYIADTYNHKIKMITVANKECTTLAGSGKQGMNDGLMEAAEFYEPHGLCMDPNSNTLLVADTNNHVIRCIDLNNNTVNTLHIIAAAQVESSQVEIITIIADRVCSLILHLKINESAKIIENVNSKWEVLLDNPFSAKYLTFPSLKGLMSQTQEKNFISLNLSAQDIEISTATFRIDVQFRYCTEDLCGIFKERYNVVVTFNDMTSLTDNTSASNIQLEENIVLM